MHNEQLVTVSSTLPNYHCYFKHDNVLAVSENEDDLPFAYFLFEKSYPELILLSIAVDYPNAINMADLVMKTLKATPNVVLAEPFFISSDGSTYLGDEAFERWSVESSDLNQLKPASSQKH